MYNLLNKYSQIWNYFPYALNNIGVL
jgi:hypothetical protein